MITINKDASQLITSKTMAMALLIILIAFFSIPGLILSAPNYSTFTKIQMPPGVTGPESADFDIIRQGPYVTVADGRILKWRGSKLGFTDFAHTSPKRTKELCDNTTNLELGPVCGRPLALSFHYSTGIIYIADAYFGLLEVGPLGGLANPIANSAEGVPFKFLTGVDVDLLTGTVYFSDASAKYDLRDYIVEIGKIRNDFTGRFMKYNPLTRKVTVLMRGLNGGGGPLVSRNRKYVLVPEFRSGNIYKHWLCGPKANSTKLLLNVAGIVNKIKRAGGKGQFWVATGLIKKNQEGATTLTIPQGLKINGFGKVLQTVSFAAQFYNKSISVVQEQDGALYVGSPLADFIGKYTC